MALYNTKAETKIQSKCRTYYPNFHDKPLSEKFYSRHENIINIGRNVSNKTRGISYFLSEEQKKQAPRTFNQTYGWFANLKNFEYEVKSLINVKSPLQEKADYYGIKIDEQRAIEPRTRYYAPVTENQCYGWIQNYTCLDINKPILWHGVKLDKYLKNVLQITDKGNKRTLLNR
ncbi:uncharacterized protein LOC119685129 [Teleopsis dalmanni]|uniref:uncharacterized protein LOC119685129 n=1 Tax=Teleopsis dalmanni TaxID=139649 RepID=UPI0018CD59D7|nr:uncharacterized protein LOC119685129 [Teleopsis dalmanni]